MIFPFILSVGPAGRSRSARCRVRRLRCATLSANGMDSGQTMSAT